MSHQVVELFDPNRRHDLTVRRVISEHIDRQMRSLGEARRWSSVRPSPAIRIFAKTTKKIAAGTERLPTPSRLHKRNPSATAARLAAAAAVAAVAVLGDSSIPDNDDFDDSHATGRSEREVHGSTLHAEKMHSDG